MSCQHGGVNYYAPVTYAANPKNKPYGRKVRRAAHSPLRPGCCCHNKSNDRDCGRSRSSESKFCWQHKKKCGQVNDRQGCRTKFKNRKISNRRSLSIPRATRPLSKQRSGPAALATGPLIQKRMADLSDLIRMIDQNPNADAATVAKQIQQLRKQKDELEEVVRPDKPTKKARKGYEWQQIFDPKEGVMWVEVPKF